MFRAFTEHKHHRIDDVRFSRTIWTDYGRERLFEREWQKKREQVLDNREEERQKAINSSIAPIYEFDKDVLDLADLKVTKKGIKTSTGFDYGLDSDLKGKDFT